MASPFSLALNATLKTSLVTTQSVPCILWSVTESNEKRDENRKVQMDELHRAIGEFVVAFETITHQQYSCILWLLASAGLNDQQIVQILLSGKNAEPLRQLLQSLLGHMRPSNVAEEAIVKNILDRHKSLIERRNEVVHGTWHIGWGNEHTTDWGEAAGFKLGKDKDGAKVKGFKYRVEDFEELAREAKELAKAYFRLSGCFTGCHAVERNFDVDDDGNVSAPNTVV